MISSIVLYFILICCISHQTITLRIQDRAQLLFIMIFYSVDSFEAAVEEATLAGVATRKRFVLSPHNEEGKHFDRHSRM